MSRQGLGQEKRRFQVQVHHLVPATLGKVVKRRAPGSAGVVDQYIELLLVRREGCCQRLGADNRRDIGGQGDTMTQSRQFARRLITDLRLARRDIDLGSLGQKTRCNHASDTTRATCNQGDSAFKRKKFVHRRRSFLKPKLSLMPRGRQSLGRQRPRAGIIAFFFSQWSPCHGQRISY